ncbi:MAG: glycosyltransferase family A protein [Planctomycetaceae bacterium]|nr:glycosyltransferase family 2 protein [Planctomycetaceae bacterium]
MISVVICTFNRAPLLRQAVESFLAQEAMQALDYELIVVDNNSRDDTAKVIEPFMSDPHVRYVLEPQQGLSHARNRGIAESKGDIVAFLDDDVLLDRHWLRNLDTSFNETRADIIGGRADLLLDGPAPVWMGPKFEIWLSRVDLGPVRKPVTSGIFGLNLAFRKAALEEIGGFSPAMGRTGKTLFAGEEDAAIRAVLARGGTVIYDPDVKVQHISGSRANWRYFRRSAFDRGRQSAMEFYDSARPGRFRMLKMLAGSCLSIVRQYLKAVLTLNPYKRHLIWRRIWGTVGAIRQYLQIMCGKAVSR